MAAARAALGPLSAGQSVPLEFTVNPASVAAARAALGPLAAGKTIPVNVDSASLMKADTAVRALTADTVKSGDAATRASARYFSLWGLLSQKITLSGGLFGTAPVIGEVSGWHLLADSIIEVGAVVIPATIALGAFGLAGYAAGQQVYTAMMNLHTVSAATGQAIPGLSGSFARLQASVKPQVFSLFGDALTVANHQTGSFATLATGAGSALDQLDSRFTVAITSGKGFSTFAAGAAADLGKIGTVVGNLGGVFGNVFKDMPGYAEDFLNLAVAGSHFLEVASAAAGPVIKAGLALHGAFLYGGLAVTALVKAGTPLSLMAVSAAAKLGIMGESALTAAGHLGATDHQMASLASSLGGVIGPAGFVKVGEDAEGAASRTGLLARAAGLLPDILTGPSGIAIAAGAAAAGVGFLAYKMVVAKDATTQWAASLLSAAETQSTFGGIIAATDAAISTYGVAVAGARSSLKVLTTSSDTFGASQADLTQQYGIQAQRMNDVNAVRKTAVTEQGLEATRAGQLVTTFGSLSKAMGIFNLVNIKASALSKDTASQWAEDMQTARGYLNTVTELAGYQGGRALAAQQAMLLGQSAQAKAVQQVTAAEDSYITTLIGGEQAFTAWVTDLGQARTDAAKTGASLAGLSKNSLTLAGDFWSTLIPAGQKQIDALNAQFIGTNQLTGAVADIAKGLLPFARGNDAARAAVMDLVDNALGPGTVTLRNMNGWVGRNSTSLAGFKAIVDQSTVAASQLAQGLQNDLNAAFRQDLLASTGANTALKAYTAELASNRQETGEGRADRAQLIRDLEASGLSAKQAGAYVDGLSRSLGKIPKSETAKVTLNGNGTYTVHGAVVYPTTTGAAPPHQIYRAATGWKVPGFGGGDRWPVLVEGGETIVPKQLTPAVAPLMKAHGVPGFSAGGVVPDYSGNVPGLYPWLAGNLNATVGSMAAAMAKGFAASAAAASAAAFSGAGVAATGPLQMYAKDLLAAHGWASQWAAFNDIVMRESGWRVNAANPSSGAYGIPQALPGSKMAAAGADWQTSGYTQLRWMIDDYIGPVYGSPAAADAHELQHHWYDQGLNGPWLPPGLSLAANMTGAPEAVVRPDQLISLAQGGGGTTYTANFPDAWSAMALEQQVRSAFTAMNLNESRQARIGRQQ